VGELGAVGGFVEVGEQLGRERTLLVDAGLTDVATEGCPPILVAAVGRRP
jgi:hypothetical protein